MRRKAAVPSIGELYQMLLAECFLGLQELRERGAEVNLHDRFQIIAVADKVLANLSKRAAHEEGENIGWAARKYAAAFPASIAPRVGPGEFVEDETDGDMLEDGQHDES